MIELSNSPRKWDSGMMCVGVTGIDRKTLKPQYVQLNPSPESKVHYVNVLAHELGHVFNNTARERRGYGVIDTYTWSCEVKAWLWAIMHLPPHEIDPTEIDTCLTHYAKQMLDSRNCLNDVSNILTLAQARKEGRI